MKICNDGDQIYIDYVAGKPYMECENVTESGHAIDLTKSVSFYGFKGKAEIQCKKNLTLFKIRSSIPLLMQVKFFNMIISASGIAIELDDRARTELVFQNTSVRNSQNGIYSRNSGECFIKILNSSFEQHCNCGIHLKCFNITAQIISSSFKFSSVYLANTASKPEVCQSQKIEVLCHDTAFDGENAQMCLGNMFLVKPFAAAVNVTITDSQFRNHSGFSCLIGKFSTMYIHDHYSTCRNTTYIFLKGLLFENNYNKLSAVKITAGFLNHTFFNVEMKDSILRNNSKALSLKTKYFGKYLATSPTIFLTNNTFVDNFYKFNAPYIAAAMYFTAGNMRVSSCRFLDNKVGSNPYSAVVTISYLSMASFIDCYFENKQTSTQSKQLFASGNKLIKFIGKNTFNLIALKEKQSVFTHIPTSARNGMVLKKDFKILCPKSYKLNAQKLCRDSKKTITCYYINVQCEKCPAKTYTVERGEFIFNKSNEIQCQQCPRGGDCGRGVVTAKPNFWGYITMKKVIFVQCPRGYCCETCVTYDSCHGKRYGTLCGRCPEGTSESLFSTQCISNKECSLNYFFTIGTIAVLVLYLIFFLYQPEISSFFRRYLIIKCLSFSKSTRHDNISNDGNHGNDSSSSGIIKILFYYYQVCTLLKSSVGPLKNGQFIHDFKDVIARVMNMILVNLPSFNCPLSDLRAVPKAVILHSVGYCLLGLLGLLWLASKLFLTIEILTHGPNAIALQPITARTGDSARASKLTISQRIVSAFTYISLLMYASSAQLCLSLLYCVPVGDSKVLFLDGHIKCYQTFQYFLLACLVSSILPFCLVPVLGSYLLKFGRIGVKQFCAACIFPLPFCCFWLYLLLKERHRGNTGIYITIEENDNAIQQDNNETHGTGDEEIVSIRTGNDASISKKSESAIISVLLGPFRSHQAFWCFPSSHIPWEGFLIFRRLVLIIVLTFVYDIELRLFLALTLCVGIMLVHTFVNPFQRQRDNVLESFSLGTHVIICGSTLIKALYYGEDYSSFSNSFPLLNGIENILVIAPLSIIMIYVIISIIIKLVFGVKLCVSVLILKIRRCILSFIT